MKKRRKSQETEEMRLERIRLHKTTQPRVVKDKKKYDRKRQARQNDGLFNLSQDNELISVISILR